MNLESKYAFSNVDPLVKVSGFSPYCAKCDLLIPIGHTARKYDGATYYHAVCPNLPLRNFAQRRLPAVGTYKYPMVVDMGRKF